MQHANTETILDLIRRKSADPNAPPPPPAKPRVETYTCTLCKDIKWVIDPRQGQTGKAVPCICNQTARQANEPTISIQHPDDLAIRLTSLARGAHNQRAIQAVETLITDRCGLLTLTGLPGRGKTTLLHALVNELRHIGVSGEYTTAADLLDYLREGFSQSGEYDRRWRRVLNMPVLAIDDLDRFARTDWSLERMPALLDARGKLANRIVTAVALDTQLGQILSQTALPERIVRRLTDAHARVVPVFER
jgi:DNA replication protein DnaC